MLTLPAFAGDAISTQFEQTAVGPDMNSYYQGADYERWRGIFERRGREVFDRRREVIDALNIRPGMRIADVGAGTGLYTMLFARAVGDGGKVYAVDISESFVHAIAERSARAGLDNVVAVVNHQKGTRLAPHSVDLVFLADSYHHFEYPLSMLASIHQALAPEGELSIIDFRRIPGLSSPWIMGHVRAGRDQIVAEVQTAGFRLVDEPLQLKDNYFVVFRKLSTEPLQ
jgi:ubiquinone/menaquinone biosynthesis C-methylase UbiE